MFISIKWLYQINENFITHLQHYEELRELMCFSMIERLFRRYRMYFMKKGIYRHYKGFEYKVLGISRHSETLEELVVYQALYADYRLWVRPIEMFNSDIEIDGVVQERFTFIKESSVLESPEVESVH